MSVCGAPESQGDPGAGEQNRFLLPRGVGYHLLGTHTLPGTPTGARAHGFRARKHVPGRQACFVWDFHGYLSDGDFLVVKQGREDATRNKKRKSLKHVFPITLRNRVRNHQQGKDELPRKKKKKQKKNV